MKRITGKVVVTGGAGFIGSHIVEELLNHDCEIVVIDDLSTGRKENIEPFEKYITFVKGSILDVKMLQETFRGADYIFHQAAIPSVPKSIDDPRLTHDVNVGGTFNVFHVASEEDVKKIVYASSASVYGDSEELPKHEDMQTMPKSPYALHKKINENYGKLFFDAFGLDTVGLRYFNVFGPRQDPNSPYAAVIPIFANNIKAKKNPQIYGDGETSRDFVYVDNVVSANINACLNAKIGGEVFNVAHGEKVSLNDLVRHIAAHLGKDVSVEYLDFREGDIKHSLADISKSRRLLGYRPTVDFLEGLRRTLDSL